VSARFRSRLAWVQQETPGASRGIGGTDELVIPFEVALPFDAAASTTRAIHRDDKMVGSARRPGEWSAAEQMDV